jgi:hypothetical protein
MNDKQPRAQLIDMLRRLPAQLEYLVGALAPDELSAPGGPGEWTAAQVIHHLADSHANGYLRCRRIVVENAPELQLYSQAQWGALPDAHDADVSASLAMLHGLHARWAVFWESLPENAWQRTGIHPTQGSLTLADLLAVYAGHGETHIDQIRRGVVARYAGPGTPPPATHAELLARFDREWARLRGLAARLSLADLEIRGDGGWSPKDHLAHVTTWERYLAVTEIGGRPVVDALGFAFEEAGRKLSIDEINARIFAANAAKSSAQVLAEFDTVHADARAAVAGINFAAWSGPTHEWYDHYLEHWRLLPIAA